MMSSTLTEAESAPAAPRAGADLRAARERLGWPIEDVAAALRIRQPHLEALEDGRIDLLPGYAYAVGFLRTYAKTLGLDPDEIVRRFKAEATEVDRRTELVFPAPMPQRGLPTGAVILLGVVLAIGAYAGWYRLSGEGRLPPETVAPIPQHLASLADQAVPPLPSHATILASPASPRSAVAQAGHAGDAANPQQPAGGQSNGSQDAAGVAPQTAVAAGSGQAPASAARSSQQPAVATAAAPADGQQPAPPVPAISPTSAAAASVPPPPVVAMTSPAAPSPAATPDAAAPDPSQITLKATADAWVQVRDRSGGGILLNRILHSGDTWPVPPHANLVLTTGNAGGTELVVGSTTVQVPGGSGAVRRDLPLDAEMIKDGRFAQLTSAASQASGSTGHTGQTGVARSAEQ